MTTDTKQDPIVRLKKLVDALDPEQRERLEQAGIVVPSGDISQLASGKYTWGLRCTACNKIALFFVGDSWDLGNGNIVKKPPSLPHNRVLWTQALPPDQIDRNNIRCQHCKVTVPMNSDGSFNQLRGRIQRIAEFEESRDKSHDREYVKATTRELTKETGALSVELPANYHSREASGPVSKVIERQAMEAGEEGALQRLENLASASGATQLVKTGKTQ